MSIEHNLGMHLKRKLFGCKEWAPYNFSWPSDSNRYEGRGIKRLPDGSSNTFGHW